MGHNNGMHRVMRGYEKPGVEEGHDWHEGKREKIEVPPKWDAQGHGQGGSPKHDYYQCSRESAR
jgi:hypothetical protein